MAEAKLNESSPVLTRSSPDRRRASSPLDRVSVAVIGTGLTARGKQAHPFSGGSGLVVTGMIDGKPMADQLAQTGQDLGAVIVALAGADGRRQRGFIAESQPVQRIAGRLWCRVAQSPFHDAQHVCRHADVKAQVAVGGGPHLVVEEVSDSGDELRRRSGGRGSSSWGALEEGQKIEFSFGGCADRSRPRRCRNHHIAANALD